ncbi:GNAT family N-acetyltransferase [Marinomonas sp. C1424]|uniref:GNAT family N-acetyltransferase n=2 Tax=Marinomonas transparens TaxID=2795388 RepID=A0A934JT93_9GAMM|nr:GNAT family N-acetyltransferase [Marinomonas transparens]
MNTFYPSAELVPALWFPLVKKFYQAYYPSGKPNKADPIWVIRNKGKVLCAVRLKQFSNCQLLTAMVTAPEYRNKGLGSHLISNIHSPLEQSSSYCFAFTHLVAFYTRNHFQEIPPIELPKELFNRFYAYTSQGRNLTPMRYKSS